MNFLDAVNFDYSTGPDVGIGNSYGNYSAPAVGGTVRWDTPGDPGSAFESMNYGGAIPGASTGGDWMGRPMASPYYPQSYEAARPSVPAQQMTSFSAGNPRASMSEGLPWAQPTPVRMGSGGSINLGTGVPVQSQFLDQLRSVLNNPGQLSSHPAFQFIQEQGEKALGRSAGARRMRFAGKTMQDFMDYGQRAASQYWGDVAGQLRSSIGPEMDVGRYNARAGESQAAGRALVDDPYGRGRQLAAQYRTADEAAAAALGRIQGASSQAKASVANAVRQQWLAGRQLLEGNI